MTEKAREELVPQLDIIIKGIKSKSYSGLVTFEQIESVVADFILAREKRIIERLLEYTEHDKRCLCSQWRIGEPTEDGRYRTLYGYGKQEKWYFDKEEPECSCGLNSICKEYLKGGKP
jgi:hypothetical protein